MDELYYWTSNKMEKEEHEQEQRD